MECWKRRGVKNCQSCCHYKNCITKRYNSDLNEAEYKLLCAIIQSAVTDYKYAKKCNDQGKMAALESFIRQKADLYTNYNVSGDYIMHHLKN